MQSIFRTVKKKINLRRLSAVWLILIVAELFCPTLCDASAFSGEADSNQTSSNISRQVPTEEGNYLSVCEHSNADHGQQMVCHDECLCHATALPNLGIMRHKETLIKSDPIAFNFSNPILNSLPPPDNPPKLS